MKSVVQFVKEVKLELSRVVWPSKQEWSGSTIVVLILMSVFAAYLFFVDKGLDLFMRQILRIYS